MPEIPRNGWYEVRLAHCFNGRRATNAPVTVHHADGETLVRINQQEEPAHGRLFRSVGTFRFTAGRGGWVRIGNEGTDGKYVIVDAVQFLPSTPPAAKGQESSAAIAPARRIGFLHEVTKGTENKF